MKNVKYLCEKFCSYQNLHNFVRSIRHNTTKQNIMKSVKLTTAQIEKLSLALAHQFMGKSLAFGNKYGYNDNQFYVGKMVFISQNQSQSLNDSQSIGNKTWGKALKATGCTERIETAHNTFYYFVSVNVSKIMQFSNGQEVINQALMMVALQNANN